MGGGEGSNELHNRVSYLVTQTAPSILCMWKAGGKSPGSY